MEKLGGGGVIREERGGGPYREGWKGSPGDRREMHWREIKTLRLGAVESRWGDGRGGEGSGG